MGLVAWWLWRVRDRFRAGALFAFYLLLSGTERLLVEFLRRNHRILLGLTVPQLESIAAMVAGAIWLFLLLRGGGRKRRREAAPAVRAHRLPRRPTPRRAAGGRRRARLVEVVPAVAGLPAIPSSKPRAR